MRMSLMILRLMPMRTRTTTHLQAMKILMKMVNHLHASEENYPGVQYPKIPVDSALLAEDDRQLPKHMPATDNPLSQKVSSARLYHMPHAKKAEMNELQQLLKSGCYKALFSIA